eukprot:766299-Hanusia_phi.AAC.3
MTASFPLLLQIDVKHKQKSTDGQEALSTNDDDVDGGASTRCKVHTNSCAESQLMCRAPKARYSDSHDDEEGRLRRDRGEALVPGPARAIFGYDSDSVCELAFAEGQLLEVGSPLTQQSCIPRSAILSERRALGLGGARGWMVPCADGSWRKRNGEDRASSSDTTKLTHYL